jgi:hypothetical protein
MLRDDLAGLSGLQLQLTRTAKRILSNSSLNGRLHIYPIADYSENISAIHREQPE